MAVTATPIFVQSVHNRQVQVTTANSNRDGSTGTYSTAITAGANGSLVDLISFQATVTSAAGLIRIFYAEDAATYRLIGEVVTKAATVSGTVPGDNELWVPPGGVPFDMAANSTIKFNIANTETWNCNCQMGDY